VRCLGAGAHHCVAVHTDGEVYAWGVGDAGRLGFGDGDTGAEGGMGGRGFPTLVKDLRSVRILHCACGYAHSIVVSSTGQLYAWGSAMHGQVGLGPVDSRFDLFCPRPTLIPTPRNVMVCRGWTDDMQPCTDRGVLRHMYSLNAWHVDQHTPRRLQLRGTCTCGGTRTQESWGSAEVRFSSCCACATAHVLTPRFTFSERRRVHAVSGGITRSKASASCQSRLRKLACRVVHRDR